MRKQSVDDDNLDLHSSLLSKIGKISSKSHKMHRHIEEVIDRTIAAIEQSEQEIIGGAEDWRSGLHNLHVKMTQIKPLKSIKDEYNEFYKKVSGFGKSIEDLPAKNELAPQLPQLFEQEQLGLIQESIADHYLTQRNYEAASFHTGKQSQQQLYEECFQLQSDILRGQFDRPADWVDRHCTVIDENAIAYEIKKMKVIKLVQQKKADEAIAYLRKSLCMYSDSKGAEIGKLMNFIITQSDCYWGSESSYSDIFRQRYGCFQNISLQELADKFVRVYSQHNKISLVNPVSKCHEVGLRFRQQFLQQAKHVQSKELPKSLPFAIKTGPELKFHSEFYCPVSKEIYGPGEQNIVLGCAHMMSSPAFARLIEGRDSRRKTKCPICQTDLAMDQHTKAKF